MTTLPRGINDAYGGIKPVIPVFQVNADGDAAGALPAVGRAAAEASLPVAVSSEDLAAIGATDETAPASDTATAGLNGRLQRIAQRLTSALTGIVLASGTNTIGATKDAGPNWTTSLGVSGARYTSADRSGSAASITDVPTSGQKIVLDDVILSADTAMRVDFKEETSGTVLLSIYLSANSSTQLTTRAKLKLATADKKLQIQTSVAGNIAVTPLYHSEA